MSYKIVLIEDDPIFTFLLLKVIKAVELQGALFDFTHGLEALEFLKKDYHKEHKYIIFLDLNMPVMNGWQFMDHFNSFADTRNCMVFILTSSNNQRDIDILKENPLVADFITKPISEPIIKNLKEMILAKFED